MSTCFYQLNLSNDLSVGVYSCELYAVLTNNQKSEVKTYTLEVIEKTLTKKVKDQELTVSELATNVQTLTTNMGNVSIQDVEMIAEDAYNYSALASKFLYDGNSITGWSFGDGTGEKSFFRILAEKFEIGSGVDSYVPFSIANGEIYFNGKVNFANNSNIATIGALTSNILFSVPQNVSVTYDSDRVFATFSTVFLAPSMNPVMWENLATQENYHKLLDRGIKFIEPESGDMACGEFGTGRLPEPKHIIDEIVNNLNYKKKIQKQFNNISVVITAGPTIENIDPVRFISNKSSGKQGYAIASELSNRGADVTVISGPVDIPPPECNKLIKITSAQEMYDKTISILPADIVICSAAVADWRLIPEINNNHSLNTKHKIKKSNHNLRFTTLKNPDILETISKSKLRPKLIVGFSAETENIIENAKSKLISKELDLILANDVSQNKVFGKDTNKVYVLTNNNCEEWSEQSKKSVASNLANKINEMFFS